MGETDKIVTHWPDGTPRDSRDIESDPQGLLIVQPGEPLRAAAATASNTEES
ncbi:hypothetical protein [Bordetella hinzii]|uniref:ASPIC/UnbV domain-containing protein n=1 Tax=Bordetella hinzii OH87 BAL007II TaxID=1331262 RepID=A0ABR4R6Q9_9BORD|nr:hypothetical protein [Bordetella hinzii]KCB26131.1 hypothetical protein L544_3261 [Bordetella hinzii OH87 BAL007II]